MCNLVLIQASICLDFSLFRLHLLDFVLSGFLHKIHCSMVEAMQYYHAYWMDRNMLFIGFFMFSKKDGDTASPLGVTEE